MTTLNEMIRKKTIALLDPDPWIRGSLSLLFLQSESCLLMAFDNVADGMKALETQRFDIIICDTAISGQDGIAFLMRAGRLQPGALTILTAAYPLGETAEIAARAGIHGCLQKPFTFDVLEKTLGGLIDDNSTGNGKSARKADRQDRDRKESNPRAGRWS